MYGLARNDVMTHNYASLHHFSHELTAELSPPYVYDQINVRISFAA